MGRARLDPAGDAAYIRPIGAARSARPHAANTER